MKRVDFRRPNARTPGRIGLIRKRPSNQERRHGKFSDEPWKPAPRDALELVLG
jgi:hypothetical protein